VAPRLLSREPAAELVVRRRVNRPNTSREAPMRLHLLVAVAAGLLLAADAPQQGDAHKDAEKLQGTWKVVSMEKDGKQAPDEVIREQKPWVIKGDKIITDEKAKDGTSTYKLDPSKKPKAIDISHPESDVKSTPGIYALEGDTLKLCLSYPANKDRPTEFAAKKGSKVLLIVFKREKR
jgi:uncharacterized protein (TIGR03067 family)